MQKVNISSRFFSQDIVSSFNILDTKKLPANDSSDLLAYGEDSVELMLAQYGTEQPAETINGDEYTKEALISPEISTEWETFKATYLSRQKELCTHS